MIQTHARTGRRGGVEAGFRAAWGPAGGETGPDGVVGRHGGATDAAVQAPRHEPAPGEDTHAEEAEDGADGDEDGAFGQRGLLHKRGGGGVRDDLGGDAGAGDDGNGSS